MTEEPRINGQFVKEVVLPFSRFPGEDPILGPEMRSTGEVMGVGATFGTAFAKAEIGAGTHFPMEGTAFLSVNDNDQDAVLPIAAGLSEMGFRLVATKGTGAHLRNAGIECRDMFKVSEGRPNVVDLMKNGEIHLILNTPLGRESYVDEKVMRQTATQYGVPLVTTLSGGYAMVEAIRALRSGEATAEVQSLQEIYPDRSTVATPSRAKVATLARVQGTKSPGPGTE